MRYLMHAKWLFAALTCMLFWGSYLAAEEERLDKLLGTTFRYHIDNDMKNFFDMMTPTNSGKWGKVERTRDEYDWWLIDRMFKFCRDYDKVAKQHTFVWGVAQPDWINSAIAKEEVREWMTDFRDRFGDQVAMIDVVNEVPHAPPGYRSGLGGSGETGYDWVVWCYEQARELFPNSLLILNDYAVIRNVQGTRDHMIEISGILQERGLVDIIGCQAHGLERIDGEEIKESLDILAAATGLPIHITEYDVDMSDDQRQLEIVREQFPVMWEHPHVRRVSFWGHVQPLWKDHTHLVNDNGSDRPAFTWLKQYMASQPGQASAPVPANGATIPYTDQIHLAWTNGSAATSRKVYFGTSPVLDADDFLVEQFEHDINISTADLSYGVTYYWRVDEQNRNGVTEGPVWSFTLPYQALDAEITSDKLFGQAPLDINVAASARFGELSYTYSWDFNGDGQEDATTATSSYQFTTPGTYHVTLTVDDGLNSVDRILEIVVGGSGDTVAPTQPAGLAAENVAQTSLDLSWSPSTDASGYVIYELFHNSVSLGYTTTPTWSVDGLVADSNQHFQVQAFDASGNVSALSEPLLLTTLPLATLAINMGGEEYLHSSGVVYEADRGYDTGKKTGGGNDAVLDTEDDTLYRNQRFGKSMNYNLPVPNGHYQLVLHFNEGYFDGRNKRPMDISVEGEQILSEFDVYNITEAKNKAYDHVMPSLYITEGQLDLHFYGSDSRGDGNNASVAGFKLVPLPGTELPFSVNISPNGIAGTAPLLVPFAAAVSGADDDGSVSISWDFDNDGIIDATGSSPEYVYSEPGMYTAVAIATNGSEEVSDSITVQVDALDVTAPSVPATLAATNVASTGFDLSWQPSIDDQSAITYQVYQDGAFFGETSATAMAISGLVAESTYSFTVRARDAAGNTSAPSVALAVETAGDSSPTPADMLAVNIGGEQYTSLSGVVYAADTGFNGGQVRSTTAAIANTDDDTLYQTLRFGNPLAYELPVANGDYVLTLHCNEHYFTDAGLRVFSIDVEGQRLVSDLDIVAASGGQNTAYDIAVPVTIADGALSISGSGSVNNAMLAGLKLEAVALPAVPHNLVASAVGIDSVELSWEAGTDGEATVAYDVVLAGNVVGTTAATTFTVGGLSAETDYIFSVIGFDAGDNPSAASAPLSVTTLAVPSIQIPGRIEAEDADPVNGVGYSDTTSGNTGGDYRNDDLDVQATGDVDGAFNLGWIAAGEWVNYTVTTTPGTYDVTLRVASAKTDDKTVRLEVDGQPAGSVTFNTGGAGWQGWQDVVIPNVTLAGGTQSIRLFFDDGSFNLNYLDFAPSAVATNTAPVVGAGSDTMVSLATSLVLAGSVDDDGLPLAGTLTASWSQVSGPGTATFVGGDTVMPTVTFSAGGVYVLRLTGDDGALTAFDDVQVTVIDTLSLDVTSIVLKGLVSGGVAPTVSIDGTPVTVNTDGTWEVEISAPGEFSGQPRLQADDSATEQQVQRDVVVDEFSVISGDN